MDWMMVLVYHDFSVTINFFWVINCTYCCLCWFSVCFMFLYGAGTFLPPINNISPYYAQQSCTFRGVELCSPGSGGDTLHWELAQGVSGGWPLGFPLAYPFQKVLTSMAG